MHTGLWIPESAKAATPGDYVSAEHQRIAELVNEFDPDLYLAYIPAEKRAPGDAPFAVIAKPDGQPEYVALYADTIDERILQRLYQADNERRDPSDRISDMEAHNAAQDAIKRKKMEEWREEQRELAASILRSPKSVYKHNGVEYR